MRILRLSRPWRRPGSACGRPSEVYRDLDGRGIAEAGADVLAGAYWQHARHRTGRDRLSGAKSVAVLPALFGQPPQRPQRIAHDVGAHALPAQHAVDFKPYGYGRKSLAPG